MSAAGHGISLTVFAITIVLAFVFSVLGRVRARHTGGESVSSQRLNRWLVGLSAGATANSGFVVTGAVGLGYTAGVHGIALPLAWLLGDLVFWAFFPKRINRTGHRVGANTVADLITASLDRGKARTIRRLIAVVVIACLSGYTAAQWIAGQKFVTGAFGLPAESALFIFAAMIVSYTVIGGFRGSVYTDSYQAVLRLAATTVALIAVALSASGDYAEFSARIAAAGPDFLALFPGMTVGAACAFVAGYAAAALGFGLGQPQVLTRYISASSAEEAQKAKWIYIFFVQYTWIAMTGFGVILRGVMPDLPDAETGLAAFFAAKMPPVLTGIIIADIFATIAATANSLIVAMAQSARFDLVGTHGKSERTSLLIPAIVVGAGTMILSYVINGTVVTLALSSVAIMGAGLAPSVLAQVLDWRPTFAAIVLSIVTGTLTAIAWKFAGADSVLNEALPGMLAGGAVHAVAYRLTRHLKPK